VIVRFVDINGIVDHHCLINFPFINENHLMALLLLFYISVIIEYNSYPKIRMKLPLHACFNNIMLFLSYLKFVKIYIMLSCTYYAC